MFKVFLLSLELLSCTLRNRHVTSQLSTLLYKVFIEILSRPTYDRSTTRLTVIVHFVSVFCEVMTFDLLA